MRLTVLNFQRRPISRGNSGKTDPLPVPLQHRLLRQTATVTSAAPAPGLPRKFRPLHPGCHLRVKWTVRPRYCGCQVTNPTSCILRLRKGTTRVNMRPPEGGESAQSTERKRLGEQEPNCHKLRGTDG